MKITDVKVFPEKKTADVWDAVTDTEIVNVTGSDIAAHLVTRLTDAGDTVVGKTETDFTVKAGGKVLVKQSVLTYSPLLGEVYVMSCALFVNGAEISRQSAALTFAR